MPVSSFPMTPSMVVLPVRTSSKVRVPSMRVALGGVALLCLSDHCLELLDPLQEPGTSWPLGRSAVWGLLKSASHEEASPAHLSMNVFALPDGRGTILCCYTKPLAVLVLWLLRLRHLTFRCSTETFAHLARNFRVLLGRQLRRNNACHFPPCCHALGEASKQKTGTV